MEGTTRYLWVFTYAIEGQQYACPYYLESQQIAEAFINNMLSYAKHIKKISLEEKKDGYKFGERYLPYIEEKRARKSYP